MTQTPQTAEKHSFTAEVQQVLHLVIHSLYTDKEIFVRELVSNAVDAMEKIRFLKLQNEPIIDPDAPLTLRIQTDDTAKTIAFIDSGVGMTHDELIGHLGTIAKSGSHQFLEKLQENAASSIDLIGQFGVGFYSAFIVADRVEVYTRSYKTDEAHGWKWTSKGDGSYEIEPAAGLERGTRIVLHLKNSESAFARASQIESILHKYSSFVPIPIELNGEKLQTVGAIWARRKSEVTEEEYREFYHYLAHAHEEPHYKLHFSADAPLSIHALLFVPSRSIEKMGMGRHESEVSLYSKRVLIQPKAPGLFPDWLRFLRGVVDSDDMPLNVSRETMQDSALFKKLGRTLTNRFLKMLEEESKEQSEKYQIFFDLFGHCLKEAVFTDFTHRDQVIPLLRFESSSLEPSKGTSFEAYISRMKTDQNEIYYLSAPDRRSAEESPYYEVFKEKNLEVLFLYDPRDEMVMDSLREVNGKRLKPAEKTELTLSEDESKSSGSQSLSMDEARLLSNWFKEHLKERVGEVQASKRLVQSPAAIVESDPHLTSNMRRMMRGMAAHSAHMGQNEEWLSKPNLEINPAHPVIRELNQIRQKNSELAATVAEQIWDQALFSAGLLAEPQTMVRRMNQLLEKVLAPHSS